MSRSLPEWSGATPDAAIPPRVRLRKWEAVGGRCECCTRKIMTGEGWALDHIVALINGGQHRESNLRVICDWCHKGKTREDVREKAITARKRSKHLGIKRRKGPPMMGSRESKFKRKLDGRVELR